RLSVRTANRAFRLLQSLAEVACSRPPIFARRALAPFSSRDAKLLCTALVRARTNWCHTRFFLAELRKQCLALQARITRNPRIRCAACTSAWHDSLDNSQTTSPVSLGKFCCRHRRCAGRKLSFADFVRTPS